MKNQNIITFGCRLNSFDSQIIREKANSENLNNLIMIILTGGAGMIGSIIASHLNTILNALSLGCYTRLYHLLRGHIVT